MSNVRRTDHAVQRLAQRGFLASDVDLIMAFGSEVRDGFLVRRKDREAMEAAIKSFLARIQKLEGKRLVVSDGCVVTAYHASAAEKRRLLRNDQKRRSSCRRTANAGAPCLV